MSVVRRHSGASRRGFTLIEIMVVVGIIGLFMGMGVPSLYRMLHRAGLPKLTDDIMDLCRQARARAILQGEPIKVVFHPQARTCNLEGGGASSNASSASGESQGGVTIAADVSIEMLDVNLREYKDADSVDVWFFSNGTSDEMTLILRADNNQWRKISLEITTGLPSIETDPNKWK